MRLSNCDTKVSTDGQVKQVTEEMSQEGITKTMTEWASVTFFLYLPITLSRDEARERSRFICAILAIVIDDEPR